MIDFGSTRSKQLLLNMKSYHQNVTSKQELLIMQTFIFSHPYLYEAVGILKEECYYHNIWQIKQM